MNADNRRTFGLPSIILLGVNTIVGSGIFLLPGQITSLVGNWSLIVYGLVTIIVLSIAWCFAKCAALFNRDGGAYLYAKKAFGNFVGFEIGFMRWAVGIIAWAALAAGFVTALSSIWPEVMEESTRSLLIISLISCLGILNMINLRTITFLNNVITIAKMLPLLFFVAVGVFYINKSHFVPFVLPEVEMGTFGAASLMVFYVFGGFEALVVAAGEMKNPEKNLPIAVMAVISICACFYFLIQLVSIGILGESLNDSISPMSDVAEVLLGSYGKLAVIFAMLVSIGGVNIAASFIAPKNGVALAEDGMIPEFIARKNRFGMPYIAILITVFATMMAALSGSFIQLIAISAVSRFAQHITTCLAVYVFYKKKLSPIAMGIPLIGLGGIAWLMFQAPVLQLTYGLAALFIGIPLYFLWKPVTTAEESTIPINDK